MDPLSQMSLTKVIKPPRILAVDDMQDNLALLETILEDEGYEISLVADGFAALDHIEKSPPDLILLDVMMPDMDGYEVTRRIRQNPHLPFIPILLLTAHDESNVVKGFEAGADDFVRKPVDADELAARVRAFLRLKHSIDEREQMSLQRQDFITHLTHDLRTPLVAADMMLKLFQKQAFCPLSPEMLKAIAAMLRSNHNLLEMVNTILEVHGHEAGSKTLTFITCNIGEIAQEVVQELQPLAEGKGIPLTLSMRPTEPDFDPHQLYVRGDRLELRRVLTNLIGNSIKFTDEGFVDLCLSRSTPDPTNSPSEPAWIILEVKDSGPGMSLSEQATLFQRFRKGSHKKSGSGLGLHLVHRIVSLHQGTITVDSEPGQGSLFTVKLPALAASL